MMTIREFRDKWLTDFRDSEIQRNNIWPENFKTELLKSIYKGFPIEAITVFKQDGNNFYEIINGKQRIYALESFWEGKLAIDDLFINELTDEQRNKFWNYDLNIQYAHGSFDEKVWLFHKINKNSTPLKSFEILSALFYGNLVLDLKTFIKNARPKLLKESDRGENELTILKLIAEGKKEEQFLLENKDKSLNEYRKKINSIFNFVDEIFSSHKRVSILLTLAQEYKNNKAELIANKDKINNDIKSLESKKYVSTWNPLSSYERILDRYIINKDKKRIFSKEVKETLWLQDHECKLCLQQINSFDLAEVDHIKPWIKGGTTNIKNGQLSHRYCNRKKSDHYE